MREQHRADDVAVAVHGIGAPDHRECPRRRRWCRWTRRRTRPPAPATWPAAPIRHCLARSHRRSAPNPGGISSCPRESCWRCRPARPGPTFSSTVIFLSSAATFSSRASSLANGHLGEGQISGWTAAGSSALAAGRAHPWTRLCIRASTGTAPSSTPQEVWYGQETWKGTSKTPVFERGQPMLSAAEIRGFR